MGVLRGGESELGCGCDPNRFWAASRLPGGWTVLVRAPEPHARPERACQHQRAGGSARISGKPRRGAGRHHPRPQHELATERTAQVLHRLGAGLRGPQPIRRRRPIPHRPRPAQLSLRRLRQQPQHRLTLEQRAPAPVAVPLAPARLRQISAAPRTIHPRTVPQTGDWGRGDLLR